MKERHYIYKKEGVIFDIDFGKKNSDDCAYEVLSVERKGKVDVLSIKDLGKATDWNEDNIFFYLFTIRKRHFFDNFRWSLIKET